MYIRFCLHTDSITCLLGGLQNVDFAYVRKVLPEYWLCHLFTWKSKQSGFCYVHKVLAESSLHDLFTWMSKSVDFRFGQSIDSATCLLGSLKNRVFYICK